MRDDGDFDAYAEARWPTLVRTTVLLGSALEEAVEIAGRTMAGCRLQWRTIRQAGDIDVEVYAELLEERSRALGERGPGPTDHPGVAVEADRPAVDRSDAEELLDALGQALDRLEPVDRCAVVLRHGAGLSELQVAEVLRLDPLEVEERLASATVELDPEGLVQRCR